MELLTILMDAAPIPPTEPGLFAKLFAAVAAVAGGIVFGAVKLIKKVLRGRKEEKKRKS